MLYSGTMLNIYKGSFILAFNILLSQHWLHVRITWRTFKIPVLRPHLKSIKSESLVLDISTVLNSLGDSNVWL